MQTNAIFYHLLVSFCLLKLQIDLAFIIYCVKQSLREFLFCASRPEYLQCFFTPKKGEVDNLLKKDNGDT